VVLLAIILWTIIHQTPQIATHITGYRQTMMVFLLFHTKTF